MEFIFEFILDVFFKKTDEKIDQVQGQTKKRIMRFVFGILLFIILMIMGALAVKYDLF